MLRAIWLAVGMATRLPLPDPEPVTSAEAGAALPWTVVVGALIGGLLAGADRLIEPVLGRPGASAAIIVLWAGLCGAVPLASVVRLCQALRDRRLASRTHRGEWRPAPSWVGGAVGLGTLIMKFAMLAAAPVAQRWTLLLLAPMWGRQVALCAVLLLPVGPGTEYRLREMRRHTRRRQLWIALLPVVLSGLLWQAWAAPLVILVVGLTWLLLRGLRHTMGGLVADIPEAAVEWAELTVLIGAAAAWGNL